MRGLVGGFEGEGDLVGWWGGDLGARLPLGRGLMSRQEGRNNAARKDCAAKRLALNRKRAPERMEELRGVPTLRHRFTSPTEAPP